MANIVLRDAAHWRALRSENIGGSDVAALFGLSPWKTHFELFHEKAGTIEVPDISEEEPVYIGTHMEPAIARAIAERKGWQIQKVRRYITSPRIQGLGSSLDYEILKHPRGAAPLEIKWSGSSWRFDDGLPMDIELQGQAQLAVTGRKWVGFGVLAGRKLLDFEKPRHDGAIARIEKEVVKFWASIAAGIAPAPDFDRDLKTLQQLYRDAEKGSVEHFDGELGDRLSDLCADYLRHGAIYSEAGAAKDRLKAEVLSIIKMHAVAFTERFKVAAAPIAGGTLIKERLTKPRRGFRIFERKDK